MRRRIIKGILLMVLLLILVIAIGDLMSDRRKSAIEETYAVGPIDAVNHAYIDGVRIAYREYGDSSNETIVLVHGFLGSSYDFRFLVERLEEDYHIIAPDLPGFGHSTRPNDYAYTASNHAATLHAFMTVMDIDRYHLLGHSMGGRVVLFHATDHPDTVMTLTLVAAAEASQPSRRRLPTLFYRMVFSNYYVQRYAFRNVHHDDAFNDKTYFDPMVYFSGDIPPEILRKMSSHVDLENLDALDTLDVETLILYGEQDSWTPKAIGESYHVVLPSSTLVIIEDSGHMPFIESVDAFHAAFTEFME